MLLHYNICDVQPYINWDYFFYAWGVHNKPEAEKQSLRREAEDMLVLHRDDYRTHAVFQLFGAYSEGEDIVVPVADVDGQRQESTRLPFLRQQQPGSDYLCMADFIRPFGTHAPSASRSSVPSTDSTIGIFATSVDHGMETDFDSDPYAKMMMQLLADRLAEATAERMHEEVRKTYWGYAPDEQLTMAELHVEKFQGIRPAVGYPSLPDTSLNFVIDKLIDIKQIGVRLTESGAMKPHASVSGFMFAHPQARYFALGKIGQDQLCDYARRRGLPVEVVRKFLFSNL